MSSFCLAAPGLIGFLLILESIAVRRQDGIALSKNKTFRRLIESLIVGNAVGSCCFYAAGVHPLATDA